MVSWLVHVNPEVVLVLEFVQDVLEGFPELVVMEFVGLFVFFRAVVVALVEEATDFLDFGRVIDELVDDPNVPILDSVDLSDIYKK